MNRLFSRLERWRFARGRCPCCELLFGSPLCDACRTASGIGDAPVRASLDASELIFVGAYRQPHRAGLSPLGRTLRGFKDHGDRYAGRCLAALFASNVARYVKPTDLVVPVPADILRLRERGLSPAAWLAIALARRSRSRLATSALVHAPGRPPQRSLGGAARRQNARGAYRLGPAVVRGYCIVLIDDVVTTGATLRAAASALQGGGAASVRFAVLACADEEVLSECRTKTESAGTNVTASG